MIKWHRANDLIGYSKKTIVSIPAWWAGSPPAYAPRVGACRSVLRETICL